MTRFAFITPGRLATTIATASLAFALSVSVSHQAMAACNGQVPPGVPNSTAITILCSGVGADGAGTVDTPFIVDGTSSHPNLVDTTATTATTNNILLQFNGHGRIIENSGKIINDRFVDDKTGSRSRTAIMLGASTVNAGASTTFTPGSSTLPPSGTDPLRTVVTLSGTYSGAAADAFKDQSLVLGAFDGDDFAPSTAFQILSVTKTLVTSPDTYSVVVTVAGDATSYTATDQRFSVVSNFGGGKEVGGVFYNNVLSNTGTISASISTGEIAQNKSATANPFTSSSYTAAVTGITTSVAGTYLIQNGVGGKIAATHGGIGALQAIFEGGQVRSMTIENAGIIEIERQIPLTLTSVTANAAAQATSASFAGYAAQNVGNAWAIGTEEEAEEIKINNAVGGKISAKGDYTAGIYTRAEEAKIVNRGTIEHLSSAGGTDYSKGFAIGAVSNGGGVRELELENYGTIHGDILGVNGNAFRWYMLSTAGVVTTDSVGNTTADLAAGRNDRLLINSHTGQLNSEIENKSSGKIIGNFWLSNGSHEIENKGEIVGDIDVDQRATISHTIATVCTLNSTGATTSTGCVGGIVATGTPSLSTTQVMDEDDATKKVSDIYRIATTRSFGAGATASTSTITESVTVTSGDRKFELENSGKMTGNITVNQVQPTSYAIPNVQACTRTGNAGCTATSVVGTPTTGTPATSTFDDATKVTGTTKTTPYGSTATNASAGTLVQVTGATIEFNSNVTGASGKFTFENSGTFDGDITIKDAATSENAITLVGDGFGRKADGSVGTRGLISAVNGTGNNVLNLDGQGTLRNSVFKFTTLNLMAGGSDVDDGDDEDSAGDGANFWTLASGKSFEFHTVNVLGGTLNVRGNLFGNTNIEEGAVLKGSGTIAGNVSNKGTIDVDDDTTHVVGNVVFHEGSKLSTVIAAGGNGLLQATGETEFEAGSSVEASVDGARVRNGNSYKIVSTGAGVEGLPEVEDTSALLRWTPIVEGDDLYITADINTDNIPGLSRQGAAAINGLLASASELGDKVLLIQDAEDVRTAGKQLAPDTTFATQQAAITLNQVTGQHIDARLASVGATGSSGNFAQPSGLGMKQADPNRSNLGGATSTIDEGPSGGTALWGRAFGVGMDQGRIEDVDGYDARLYGFLAGYDNWIGNDTRFGVAIGYANTSIDGKGVTSQNSTDIDSYLVELYGTYKGSGWYATGRTGYTWHDYDTRRALTVPVTDTATGSHDGQQFNAAAEVGAPMRVGGGSILTPVASLTYSNLQQDSYTEKSGAGMALSVDDQDNDSLVSGLGLKALFPVAHDTVLEARALWLHEFLDAAQDVGASFAAGGGAFTAAGPGVGRDSAALGVGLMAVVAPESTFQLNYDANVRDDFVAHIGSAELTIRY